MLNSLQRLMDFFLIYGVINTSTVKTENAFRLVPCQISGELDRA